jgi:hypothetical protein
MENIKDITENAIAFRERMHEKAETISDHELKQSWLGMIDILSRQDVNQYMTSIKQKIEDIGNFVTELSLNDLETLELYKSIDSGLDNYLKSLQARYSTK